jgi:hypothetical protein
MDIVDARERLPLNLEVERLAIEHHDRDRLLRTLARLVTDYMELGEVAAADARVAAFETQVRELRASWYAWRIPLFKSMRAMFDGRFAESERFVCEAERLAATSGDPQATRCVVMHREGLLRAAERHEEMVAHDAADRRVRAELSHGAGQQTLASLLVHARREDAERARFYLDLLGPELALPADNLFIFAYLVEGTALAGTDAQVASLYDRLRPFADRDVMMGLSLLSWEGPVSRMLGILAARLGRREVMIGHFEAALARVRALGTRPWQARCEYELARGLLVAGGPADRERARALLTSARETAEALEMPGLVQLCARRLEGTPAAPATPPPASESGAGIPFTLVVEGEYWAITHGGATFRLKDSLGLAYLARLVAEPGREVHVLDLVGGRRGGEAEAVDVGDAGELLDAEAREEYRGRLQDLRETLAEAESFGDEGRAARAREEIEFLAAELGRAVGLGGRARRAGTAAERARIAVQRRIKNALGRIEEHSPALATYLARAVKTGNFCVFRP